MRLHLLVFSLALSLPVFSAEMTRLTVEVQTLGGKPVDRAAVILLKKGKKTPWEMRTNQMGLAKFPSIAEGQARLQISAKGFQTSGQTIELNGEEQSVVVKLNPPQSQYSSHQ